MSRTIKALYICVLAQNEDIGLEKWLSAIFKIVAFGYNHYGSWPLKQLKFNQQLQNLAIPIIHCYHICWSI